MHFKIVLTMNEEKNDVLVKLVICHIEKGDYEKALEFSEMNLRRNGESSRALRYIAWCKFLVSNYTDALAHIDKAVLLEEVQHEGHYIKGRILLALNKLLEATEALKKAVGYNQLSAAYMTSLGIAYSMRQLYKEAIEFFSQGIKLNMKAAEPWYNLALIHEVMQDRAEAIIAYEEAIKICKEFYLAVISKDALSNGNILQYHYSRFVHIQFRIDDNLLVDKEIAANPKVKGICEDYFKQCANSLLVNDDYSKAAVLSNKSKGSYMNPLEKLKNPKDNNPPVTMSSNFHFLNPLELTPPKPNIHELRKQTKLQTLFSPIITSNSFQSSGGTRVYEKSNTPSSIQPQIRTQAISHSFPAPEIPSINKTEFWNQLLQSQLQSMIAHRVISYPPYISSTTVPNQSSQIKRSQINNPLPSSPSQKYNPHKHSFYQLGVKENIKCVDNNIKKINDDQLNEDCKESNVVRIPRCGIKEQLDTMVRLDLSLYKPKVRKRKYPENDKEINKEGIQKHK
jgi:tetratricopeptide (TPR) repeat protein